MSIGMPSQSSPLESLPLPSDSSILVVDEDPAFQLGLKTFLHEYVGFSRVFTANDGQQALDLIESEESIELITLDYQMPGMNGIEVLEELSKSPPRHLSVTMITGYPSGELEEEFHSFGSSRLLTKYFLPKPVEFEKLEPLMLHAHDELQVAKRNIDEDGVITVHGEAEEEDYIEAQLRHQSAKLEAIEQKIDKLKKRWRADFWTLVLAAAAIWAAVHFGWFQKLEPSWEKVKTEVSKMLPSSSPAAAGPGENESSGEAKGQTPPPAPGKPDPGAGNQNAGKSGQISKEEPKTQPENGGRPL